MQGCQHQLLSHRRETVSSLECKYSENVLARNSGNAFMDIGSMASGASFLQTILVFVVHLHFWYEFGTHTSQQLWT